MGETKKLDVMDVKELLKDVLIKNKVEVNIATVAILRLYEEYNEQQVAQMKKEREQKAQQAKEKK